MLSIEVHSRTGWRRLDRALVAPAIGESELFELRGLVAGSTVEIGPEHAQAGGNGTARIALKDCETLRGHLGLIEIRVDGAVVGEIDVLPDKLSQAAYLRLRGDLEAVWSGLVFDPTGVSRMQAHLPSPGELARRIERPVRSIVDTPRELIEARVGTRRLHSVRRPSELTRSVVQHAAQGRAGLARIPFRSTDTPENAMVAATLRKLASYARRSGDSDTETRLARVLHASHLGSASAPVNRITWGMRSDPAYRQVLSVHRMLERPELGATEGPGELRLGVRGMTRLYEYWVYLQVLLAAKELYGPPVEPGFSVLARDLPGGRARLELAAGTAVTFPGPVHIAFEPRITPRGDSWMGLEYVPHPDPARAKSMATPDVVVFQPGRPTSLVVIDAKYVARSWVERAAADIHEKYARVRYEGRPVVRYVLAAHPQRGMENRWAGYGHVPMVPGDMRPVLPLPPHRAVPSVPQVPSAHLSAAAPPPAGGLRTDIAPAIPGMDERPVVVIADQGWMHEALGDRRIDLQDLQALASHGRPSAGAFVVLPELKLLATFARAAGKRGWSVRYYEGVSRAAAAAAIVDVAAGVPSGCATVVISGDPGVIAALETHGIGAVIVSDLSSLPDLEPSAEAT